MKALQSLASDAWTKVQDVGNTVKASFMDTMSVGTTVASTLSGRTSKSTPLESLFETVKGMNTIEGGRKMEKSVSIIDTEVETRRTDILEKQIESMKRLIENMQRPEKSVGVEIEGISFFDEEDVHSWAAENLPTSLPIGYFGDIYSFLDRILQSTGELKDIEIKHKLSLAGDEALNFSSFTRECPRFFGQAITTSSGVIKTVASKSSLLALPSAAHWEDLKTCRGLKEVLHRKMVNVNQQVLKNINSRLSSHPVAKALATSCLDATYSFVTSLMVYISETHRS